MIPVRLEEVTIRASKISRALMFLSAALLPVALHSVPAVASKAQSLVDNEELTVNTFRVEADMGSMPPLIRRAHGVLITP